MVTNQCAKCIHCISECPVADISNEHLREVFHVLKDKKKHVVVQTAPSIRASLGESFGMPAGSLVAGKMVSALRKCGFEKVFDTNFGADIMIIEEATELLERIKTKRNLPMLTTCCPAWILYLEHNHPDQIPNMSSCKSPHEMLGMLSKTYYAKKAKINPKDIVVVSIMPCVAKRFESTRPELKSGVDYVLTTTELAELIKLMKIEFTGLPDSEFDPVLGISTGAAAIFGATGGVMEAILRTAYFLDSGKNLEKLELKELHRMDNIKEGSFDLNDRKVRFAAVNGLKYAPNILAKLNDYDFIEIMACVGGCIGGGGQPLPNTKEVLIKRAEALHKQDTKMKIRLAHENTAVTHIYAEFLGQPGSKEARKLLHTCYFDRSKK